MTAKKATVTRWVYLSLWPGHEVAHAHSCWKRLVATAGRRFDKSEGWCVSKIVRIEIPLPPKKARKA